MGHHAELASFVPHRLVRDLATASGGPDYGRLAVPGTALVADLAGFTRLTEDLIRREGTAGTERTTRLLNGFFERIIDLVTREGGEVTDFAGDALIALFRAEDDSGPALSDSVHAAAACGLAIRDAVTDVGRIEGVPIAVRVGIAAGPLSAARVGGRRDRWEIVLSGAPLLEVSSVLGQIPRGTVGVSDAAFTIGGDRLAGGRLASGAWALQSTDVRPGVERRHHPVEEQDEPILRGAVPVVVRAHLEHGLGGWLATLRRLSVLFLRIEGLDVDERGGLGGLHEAVQEIQGVLYRHGGSLAKVLVDDKGTMALAAFGLPRERFEYRADHALAAAMACGPALEPLGLECAAGIATGTVFCGPIGSASRREYALIGSTVNLAARLCASAGHEVLSDDATRRAANLEVRFETRTPLRLKGFEEPVAVFAPLERVELDAATRSVRLALVGREQEVARLEARVDALAAERRSGVLFVEAEAGIGKSRLVAELPRLTSDRGLDCAVVVADRLESDRPFSVWRSVFAELLDLPADLGSQARDEQQQAVARAIGGGDERGRLASLLNPVLGTSIDMSEHVADMRGETRARAALDLLTTLLAEAAADAPRVLVFDDAQWMDGRSLALLGRAIEGVEPLLVVAARRTETEEPAALEALREAEGVERITLERLAAPAARRLVSQVLGVADAPEPLTRWIHERGDGNAFFIQEVALSLQEEGLLRVEDGVLVDVPGLARLERAPLPTTVETVVNRRIDRLRLADQLCIKAASVIGLSFVREALEAIYPIEADEPLDDALDRLVDARLLVRRSDNGHDFGHRTTLEAAYQCMPGEQRQPLHRAYARHIREAEAANLVPWAPQLAHHLAEAGDLVDAIDFLEISADDARRNGAAAAEQSFWRQLFALHDQLDPAQRGDRVRIARWRRCLGMATAREAQATEAVEHLDAALALLGVRIPHSAGGRTWSLLRQAVWQVALLLVPSLLTARSPAGRKRLTEAARAASDYSEPCYLLNDNLGFLLSSLIAANLATRSGTAQVARPFQTLGYVANLARLRGLSDRYYERALRDSRSSNDGQGEILTLNSRGSAHLSFGRWAEMTTWFEQGEARALELGDRHEWEVGTLMWGHGDHFRGAYERAYDRERAVFEAATERGNLRHQRWTLFGMTRALECMGRTDEAVELLHQHEQLFDGVDEELLSERHALEAVAALHAGDDEQAREQALEASRRVLKAGPGDFTTFTPLSCACDVLLTLAERARARGDGPDGPLLDAAKQACKGMTSYGKTHPIGVPRALYFEGRLKALAGSAAAGKKRWEAALVAARATDMPVEEAIATAALGDFERARTLLAERAPAARRPVFAIEAVLAPAEA